MIEREKLIAMVRGLQNGDPDATNELFETVQSDIYYFILKTVNNDRELAEDLTQDTLIEILETIDKLQEPAAFVTWSKQIAYHKCTAYFRKKKELLVDENEDGYSVFDTIEENREEFIPDAALDHEDLKQTILQMINDLPEEQRAAILLRYFNEISVKEIADIQGVTEGTVKSRLNYGRKSIKQAVEDYEKKNGVKLHCVGVLPLMLWFFKSYRVKNDLHISSNTAMQSFVIGEESYGAAAIVGSSASASASASAAASSAVTATTTTATATAVKAAAVGGKVLAAKIIAGIAAAAVAIGGVSVGIASAQNSEKNPEQSIVSTKEENYDETSAVTEENVLIEETQTEAVCLHEHIYPEFGESDTYYAIVCGDCEAVLKDEVLSCLKGGEHFWQNAQDIFEEEGSYQEKRECAVCHAELADDTEIEDTIVQETPNTGNSNTPNEPPTEVPTEVPAEVPTEVPTEDPAEPIECEHDWSYFRGVTAEGVVDYEDRTCTKCGLYEVTIGAGGTSSCDEHDWHVNTIISDSTITEVRTCTKCGTSERVTYENACTNHTFVTWTNSEPAYDGSIWSGRKCTNCGYSIIDSKIYPSDEEDTSTEAPTETSTETPTEVPTECSHNWEPYGELMNENNEVYDWLVCAKCGESKMEYLYTVTEESTQCDHSWEKQDQFVNENNEVYDRLICTKCSESRTEYVYTIMETEDAS